MQRLEELRKKAAAAPEQPGVYQMCDQLGRIIYVGKAKNIRKRVSSYFRESTFTSMAIRPLTQLLVANVVELRFIVTPSEDEALFLENTLIKKEKPKYNVRLRDDKDYVCLRLSVNHPFPRLTVVRRPKPDGAKYFGPYVSGWAIRQMSRYLLRIFPLRSCSDNVIKNRSRPCILYDIKLCTGPCVQKISAADYAQLVEQVRLFLEGNTRPLMQQLKHEMQTAAKAMEYDKAAELRDRIEHIQASEHQQNVIFHDHRDVDVIGMAREDESMAVVILTMREGKIIGKRETLCELVDSDHELEMLETILSQHYLTDLPFVPPVVLVPVTLPSAAALAHALSGKMHRKVKIEKPQRGGRAKLLSMAQANAAMHLQQMRSQQSVKDKLLFDVKNELNLAEIPQRIETYDISNIQGTDAVGSQVTFINAEADKQYYRKYKIRTVDGANDFAMMKEILSRRFDKKTAEHFPQLILIDGGKGQLHAAEEVLRELDLVIPIAAIAKVPDDGTAKGILTDRIFVPGRKNPLTLKKDSPVLRLMQRMRDEAHRFAVAYHHKRKQKSTITSELAKIPGVGKKRQQLLLRHFGSVDKIKVATLEELRELSFLTAPTAEVIYNYFHS